jgi:hypothetical protein
MRPSLPLSMSFRASGYCFPLRRWVPIWTTCFEALATPTMCRPSSIVLLMGFSQ